MNKLKLAVISGIVFASTVAKPVLADTIGYADFKKIENN